MVNGVLDGTIESRSILHCEASECKTFWDRDVSAPLNIMRMTTELFNNQARPDRRPVASKISRTPRLVRQSMPISSRSVRTSASARHHRKDANDPPTVSTMEIVEKATVSINGLSQRDALYVWKALGLYLATQLQQKKLIKVEHFGIFGMNDALEPIFVQNPIFLQTNRLREGTSQRKRGQLSTRCGAIVNANLAQIGREFAQNCSKDVVRTVITNVIAFVGKLAKQGHVLRLSFLPLGDWSSDGDKTNFHFLAEFQTQLKRQHREIGRTKIGMDDISNNDSTGAAEPTVELNETLGSREAHFVPRCSPSLCSSQDISEPRRSRFKSDTLSQDHRGSLQSGSSVRTGSHCGSESKPMSYHTCYETRQKPSISSRKQPAKVLKKSDNQKRAERNDVRTPENGNAGNPRMADNHNVCDLVKAKLIERCGNNGLNSLSRILQLMDTSGDNALSAKELRFGLRDMGIDLSKDELALLMREFDRNGDGSICLEELLNTLRGGSLSNTRRELIEKAFRLMDRDGSNAITLASLKENYDVSLLPRVRAGKKSKEQALTEFIREWEASDCYNLTNMITLDDFVCYYHNVSACIPDDSDFQLLMCQTWHVFPTEKSSNQSDEDNNSSFSLDNRSPSLQSASLPNFPNQQNAAQPEKGERAENLNHWRYLQNLLFSDGRDKRTGYLPSICDMKQKLGVNQIWSDGDDAMNVKVFARTIRFLDRKISPKDAEQITQMVAESCGKSVLGGNTIDLRELYNSLTVSYTGIRAYKELKGTTSSHSNVIDRVRYRLLQRVSGSNHDENDGNVSHRSHVGLNGLQRLLKLMDKNDDKRLTKDELKLGLQKFGVEINFRELDHLYAFFDTDCNGCITSEEFLAGMRGDMSPRRLGFVQAAFDILDKDRDGFITQQELCSVYDVSKHPDVESGKLSASDALKLFTAQWETPGKTDGIVTKSEFEAYYRNLSASIDSDDYFELMMRNTWHISGGSGQTANSTNRRVLVTNVDGTQNIVEIQNDLGVRSTDNEKMHTCTEQGGHVATNGVKVSKSCWRTESFDDKRVARSPIISEPYSNVTTKCNATCPQVQPSFRRRRRHLTNDQNDMENASLIGTSILSDGQYESTMKSVLYERDAQRQLRDKSARLIQAHFRGFKSRQFVACVRRKMAAEAERQRQTNLENRSNRPKIARAALRTYHGF